MRLSLLSLLAALAAPAVLAQREAPEKDPRAELRVLEAALTRAADAVARPGVLTLQASACRGYRIEGVGAVLVVPPRALRTQSLLVWQRSDGRVGRRMRVLPRSEMDREIRVIEQQAAALEREAALAHQEVERAMAEVQWEIQRRQPDAAGASAAPPPPLPPEPPAAPEAPTPPAPWTLWFDAGLEEEEGPAPTAPVVARMRTALVEALSNHGGTLRSLRPEETIAAAVDFVPGFAFGGGKVEKTLVVRIRKKDLDERRAGRIGPEELKARVEVAEY